MQRILRRARCCVSVPAPAIIALAIIVCLTSTARGQILQRAIVIRDATVVTARGFVIENGDVVIKGGEITDVGRDVTAPLLSREIDGRGKTVTAGLIDVHGELGLTTTAVIARANVSSADAFNRYAVDELRSALAQGVTALYLPAGRAQGIHGLGSVIRLIPDKTSDAIGEVETRESALCLDLGSNATPVARSRMFVGVRNQLRAVLDYRDSRDEYLVALEEYQEALEEYAEKTDSGDDSKKKSDAESKKDPKAGKRKMAPQDPRPRRRRGGPRPGSGPSPAKPAKDDKKAEDDAPKKPGEVAMREDFEVILRALDREIPVRVEAHGTSEILNALALAEEFRIRVILEGATEGHLLAKRIADAKIAVVLTDIDTDGSRTGRDLRESADNGRLLRDAGVAVHVGSAGGRDAARFPLFAAQLAAARGAVGDPLRTVTSDAAKFLGLQDKIGSIRKGNAADVVLWSGDPRDPMSTVDTVFVGGRVAYEAKKGAQ